MPIFCGCCVALDGLLHRPRKAVQHISARLAGLFEGFRHHAQHQFIGYQFPGLELALDVAPDLGAALHVLAQQIPGGDMRNAEQLGKRLPCVPLPAPGGASSRILIRTPTLAGLMLASCRTLRWPG